MWEKRKEMFEEDVHEECVEEKAQRNRRGVGSQDSAKKKCPVYGKSSWDQERYHEHGVPNQSECHH